MDELTEPEAAPVRGRRGLGDWLRIGFLVLALGFGLVFVASQWNKLAPVVADLKLAPTAASVLFAVVGSWFGMLGWRAAVADVGAHMPLGGAARVFFVGQLGKYIPGSIWSFIAQAEMARDLHVSRKATFAGSVVGMVLLLGSGITVTAVFLPFGAHDALHRYWWVLLLVPVFALSLHPRITGTVIDAGLRLIRRDPLEQRPGWLGLLRSAGWYTADWLAFGLHAWLLLVAVGAPAARSLPIGIGGFALAVSLGVLFLPAPAGAGVRDAAIVVAFSAVTSPAAALATALISRLMLAILDFLLAGASALWFRKQPVMAEPRPTKARARVERGRDHD